jgi:DNA-binding response OmpR family regulator
MDTNINVLLVEDNPGDAHLLRMALADVGSAQFHLTHVQRLADIADCVRDGHFDVILLDLGLPDSKGLVTLLVTRYLAPTLAIVVLTGLDDESLAIQAVENGAQDYLVKGQWDGKLLARSLIHAVQRHRASQEIEASLAGKEDLVSQLREALRNSQSGLSEDPQRSNVPPPGARMNPEEKIMDYLRNHPEGADMAKLRGVVKMRVHETIQVIGPLMDAHKIRSSHPRFFAV